MRKRLGIEVVRNGTVVRQERAGGEASEDDGRARKARDKQAATPILLVEWFGWSCSGE